MKRKVTAWLLLCCLCLSGCTNLFDGSYVSVKPHKQQTNTDSGETVSVANFVQLYAALTEVIASGREEAVLTAAGYNQTVIETDMDRAISDALRKDPIAAYAVEHVEYELGKSAGQPALAVKITYRHNRTELLKIKQVKGMDQAEKLICSALDRCEAGIVLEIKDYKETDFIQLVESYALNHPESVMEQPRVTVGVYPEAGKNRVVELRFGYQTGRDSLKTMQEQVNPVFTSAVLYVSGDAREREKYSQLYSFLMERYDYQFETSITPAYSLLRHGVGDSRAFATVYAAMCRMADLECLVVSGTKDGESRFWNIIRDGEAYFHLDLPAGSFQMLTDSEMIGYVWDYSTYPACGETAEEEAAPTESENFENILE